MVQAYFFMPNFAQKILSEGFNANVDFSKAKDQSSKKKWESSKLLVKNLATLFGHMVLSNRKYADPS